MPQQSKTNVIEPLSLTCPRCHLQHRYCTKCCTACDRHQQTLVSIASAAAQASQGLPQASFARPSHSLLSRHLNAYETKTQPQNLPDLSTPTTSSHRWSRHRRLQERRSMGGPHQEPNHEGPCHRSRGRASNRWRREGLRLEEPHLL